MQIQKVEEEIGFAIFDRLKKPVVATDKGHRFIEQAKILLREHEKLLAISKKEEAEISGPFRLGIIPTLTPYLVPLFIEQFSTQFPKVKLKIDELKTETIIEELRRDALDGAFVATPLNENGIREKTLFYEPFFLYASKNHPLLSKKIVHETELDAQEMWLLQDGHCLRNQVVKICGIHNERSVYRNIQFEGGNLETLRNIIQRNRGCTLIPQLFAMQLSEKERKECVREFSHPAPSREVGLVYRRDQWKSDILDALRSVLTAKIPDDLKRPLDKRKTQIIGIQG